jgi:hypothetical protein
VNTALEALQLCAAENKASRGIIGKLLIHHILNLRSVYFRWFVLKMDMGMRSLRHQINRRHSPSIWKQVQLYCHKTCTIMNKPFRRGRIRTFATDLVHLQVDNDVNLVESSLFFLLELSYVLCTHKQQDK